MDAKVGFIWEGQYGNKPLLVQVMSPVGAGGHYHLYENRRFIGILTWRQGWLEWDLNNSSSLDGYCLSLIHQEILQQEQEQGFKPDIPPKATLEMMMVLPNERGRVTRWHLIYWERYGYMTP